MDTSRDDFGIAIRSAFLRKGTQQRFSLFILAVISVLLIFLETIDAKPLNAARSFVKDMIYRGSLLVSYPSEIISDTYSFTNKHINLYKNYNKLIEENKELKNNISKSEFLEMENTQLRKLIDEPSVLVSNLVSARVIFDKQSPYLNSFVINTGNNKGIKNGMAVLDGENFIGRVVDVNFFSSRVLLVSDLNSKIPVITEPTGNHAILSGHGSKETTLEYLPENHEIKNGDKVYTSGQEGIFLPGIPIGKIKLNKDIVEVILFSNLKQITFVNVNIEEVEKN
tara:strand:+ start:2259 stop:3104 length:846 start_codon:yes stop_codon:yes gene_type:complete